MRSNLIHILLSIYAGMSIPREYNDHDRFIATLVEKGLIEPDPSDVVTGYTETKKGRNLIYALCDVANEYN